MIESELDMDFVAITEEIQQECSKIEGRLDQDHRNCLVTKVQQANHHSRIQQDSRNLNQFLEDEILIGSDYGTEDAQGEGEGKVEGQYQEHRPCTGEFHLSHRSGEERIYIENQHQTGSHRNKAYDGIDNGEHSEH